MMHCVQHPVGGSVAPEDLNQEHESDARVKKKAKLNQEALHYTLRWQALLRFSSTPLPAN